LTANVFAINFPKPTSAFYVNDYANVLDTETERYIESTARALDDATSAQVVVVTINGIGDNVLEDYTIGLFREWGIGNKEKNNGVLLFVDVKGRQSRIEVGYGLEGALPDGKTGRIQDNHMLPYFRQGNYSYGIRDGFDAIVNEIYIEYGYKDGLTGNKQQTPSGQRSYGGNINRIISNGISQLFAIVGVFFLVIFIILDLRYFRGMITRSILYIMSSGSRNGRYRRGGWGGDPFSGGGRSGGIGRTGSGGRSGGAGRTGSGGRTGGGGSAGGGGSSRRW